MTITEGNFTCSCQTELNWQPKECVFVIPSSALAVKERLRHGTLRQYHLIQIHSGCAEPCTFSLCFFFGHSSHICESFKGKFWEMLCVRSIQVHSLYVLRKPEILVCKQRGRGREGLTRQPELIFSLNIAYNLVFWLCTKLQLYFL